MRFDYEIWNVVVVEAGGKGRRGMEREREREYVDDRSVDFLSWTDDMSVFFFCDWERHTTNP